MQRNMQIWTRTYAPKSKSEIVGQNKAADELSDFIKKFSSQKKKAIILYGRSGTGKTSSVYALAQELNLEVIEVNASDVRNKAEVIARLGNAASQMSLFASSKVILIDELDGLSGTKDRGGVAAVAEIIKRSSFPIIITVENPYDKKFSSIRKLCETIEFHTLAYTSIASLLRRILDSEKITYDDEAVKTIARRAGGDARAAINDLQMVIGSSKTLQKKHLELLSERDHTDSITNALLKVLKTTDPVLAITAFDLVHEDLDQVALWLDQNIPKEYTRPKDLIKAYDALSRADVFKGRIRRQQHWRYLVYVNALLSAGVAVAKDERYKGFIKYEPTRRILKLWQANMKYQKRKAIAEKIGAITHTSTHVAIQSTIPYLQQIARKDASFAKSLADECDLAKDEVAWLVR